MARDLSVYQRELDRQTQRSTRRPSGGGGDYQWFSPPKPARKGEKTRTQVRILPRPAPEGSGEDYADEWWVRADQHVLTIDGKTRVFNCPDDHDTGTDADSVCPLCALRRELYREKKPAAQELAKDLKVRSRAFAVIACPTADSEIGPYVWGFSTSLLNGIMEIAVAKRCMVDDPDTGRDMLVTVTRIGPKRYDIRYSVTDMDSAPVGDDVRAMVADVPDLTGLTKDADMAELREIAALLDPRPAGKRSSVVTEPAAPAPAPVRREPEPPVVREPDTTSYHYSGAGGDQTGISLDKVARIVADNDGDDHYVWQEGWADWKPAADVAEIAAAVKALKPPPTMTPPKPPAGPPKPPGAPPRPPKPPGGKAF